MLMIVFSCKRRVIFLWLCLMGVGVTGCVSVPDAPRIIQQARAQTEPVSIQVNDRLLTGKEAEKKIDSLAQKVQAEALLQKHLAIEQTISDTPLIAGNHVQLVLDGDQTFNAIYQAIRDAKHHIHLEYFILENIQFKHTDLQHLLIQKVNQGVQVNVIYDALGSVSTPADFFEALEKSGVNVHIFHPLDIENVVNINQRDHRKILIVDGKLAIVGGVNLSSSYQSKSRLGMRHKKITLADINQAHWKDTNLIIDGPAVAEIQKLFLSHWDPEVITYQAQYFPAVKTKGKELVRVIGSAPAKDMPAYYATLLSAIQHAEKEVFLSSGYFVPTSDQKKVLIEAAKRGVDVHLFLPGTSDSAVAMLVQHSHYEDLLKHHIHIYESDTEILHAKTVMIDGVWSVVGSSNFDYRSAASNQEIDIVVLGSATAEALKEKFYRELKQSKSIDLATFRKRPFLEKIKERFYRIFQQFF